MNNHSSQRRAAVALFLMLLALPTAAWAKGDTARLVMTCVGFERPIEIRNPAALTVENGPWGGGFIDSTKGAVAGAPTRRVCQVDFYVRYSKQDERLAYVIYYYPGKNGAPGYIYLPGRNEPWYWMNAGAMFRPGIDGTWRVASRRWEQALDQPALVAGR
jgi:hypothetical protein